MKEQELIIKSTLEQAFDIPFVVKMEGSMLDPIFTIYPDNPDDSLFLIEFSFKQRTRIIIQMRPQTYAASMISEIENAPESKKDDFSLFAHELIYGRNAKISISINNQEVDPCSPSTWPHQWTNFFGRISKSPVVDENEQFNAVEIVCNWAVPVFGMFLSLLDIIPIDNDLPDSRTEGTKTSILVTRYERSPINRQLCIVVNGCTCKICGMNFAAVYGSLGRNFIHVHHTTPVSDMGSEYKVDPVHDLIPVCPNCHAMLHRTDPPLMPEQLKQIVSGRNCR